MLGASAISNTYACNNWRHAMNTEEAKFLTAMTELDGTSGEGLFVTLGIFTFVFGLALVALALV